MIRALLSLLAVCAIATSPAFASFQIQTAPGAFDPTAREAVVEYAGPDPLVIETAGGPVEFTVEVADTPESRQRGMMWRETVPADTGMLFDFEQEQYVSIWMRNTLAPLDILFVRPNGEIAKIIDNAVPMSERSMPSDFPVLAVLELAGGRAIEANIQPGDIVRHPLFGNWDAPESPAAEEAAAQDAPAEPALADGPGR